jgi:hypothetical protein
MTTQTTPETSLAEKRTAYLSYLTQQKHALEHRFRRELESLSECERIYEEWYAAQIADALCVVEVKPNIYEMLTKGNR